MKDAATRNRPPCPDIDKYGDHRYRGTSPYRQINGGSIRDVECATCGDRSEELIPDGFAALT